MPASPDDSAALMRQGLEPRFISEAYFLRFKFDPGNYYLAGRETLDGRNVLRIEYYPKRLFNDKDAARDEDTSRARRRRQTATSSDGPSREAQTGQRRRSAPERAQRKRAQVEKDIERKFNKVALITLWVDPAEHQIVKYTFDNTELNFLPGRWLVRVGDVSASMTMGQYFQGRVAAARDWRAREPDARQRRATTRRYARDFFDYRQGEVKARIRSYTPVED